MNSNQNNEPETEDNIDRVIRDALGQKDAEEILNFSSDPSLLEMMRATLQGRTKWLTCLSFIMIFAYLGAGIYCLSKFFDTADIKEAVGWACGAIFCITTIGMIKIWYWIDMGRRMTSREIKRLELQVAALTQTLNQE